MPTSLDKSDRGAAIVGAACRFPGAPSLDAFWRLMIEGRNAVRAAPEGRWAVERFLRPGKPEAGFSYTFAGGYLDEPFVFDPAPFGLSPREAQQMDPQQRLLLEVVWEALEDAGLPPAALSGANVGVYIGASSVDYQFNASNDPAIIDSHFMTGNTLSILSNRISYVFNLKGPSITLDSACASSFSALDAAMSALEQGRIHLAIVGGVNMLLSPVPFIGFSQARMLSPTGLSRPFSQDGDGYVRAEGAGVMVLRRAGEARALGESIRAVIVGAALNCDGRTSGISLPSMEGQRDLIATLYDRLGLGPDDLAFVEAHGTGTRVGDPVEANAIGRVLGQGRAAKLPIGSVKSNIGHLESASGVAGLLKAMLALERRQLPPSLFLDKLNDAIDFEALNLAPNAAARALDLEGRAIYAGVCNYGFGGANGHAVLRAAAPQATRAHGRTRAPSLIVLSAADETALAAAADELAGTIEAGVSPAEAAATLAYGRAKFETRLAVSLGDPAAVAPALRAHAAGAREGARHVAASGRENRMPVFVYSGNGAQFATMGQAAYASNAAFRAQIARIDETFAPLAGWRIASRMTAPIDAEDLALTSLAQPLIFAVQSALTACLTQVGVRPAAVIGHSVGEVAAAEAAGALTIAEATRLVFLRSGLQEKARGRGTMMVVAADAARAAELIAASGLPVEIAATNSPGSTTVSGATEAIADLARACRAARVATVRLDIDYPFHSSHLESLRAEMLAALASIRGRGCSVPFVSTVTADLAAGETLDGDYWWRNVRQPVHFREALTAAAERFGDLFVEIGARPVLAGPIADTLRALDRKADIVATLDTKEADDPVGLIIARAVAAGARHDVETVSGARPAQLLKLPSYPFRRQYFDFEPTAEAMRSYGLLSRDPGRHPLLGGRLSDGSPEWRNLIDPVLTPYLDDHRVDGGCVVPAAGLIDMALAAGRDLFGDVALELDNFDIVRALAIAPDETREVSTRFSDVGATIEIWSRKRFASGQWTMNARGRIAPLTHAAEIAPEGPDMAHARRFAADEVYAAATRSGLDYGPAFRNVESVVADGAKSEARLRIPEAGSGAYRVGHVLHPASLDAAFHPLFLARAGERDDKTAFLPVRFRKIVVHAPGAPVSRAITSLTRETARFKTVTMALFDAGGRRVASVGEAVLRALPLWSANLPDRTFRAEAVRLKRDPAALARAARPALAALDAAPREVPEAWLLARALAVACARRLVESVCGAGASLAAVELAAPRAGLGAPLQNAWRLLEAFDFIENGALVARNPLPPPETLLAALMTRFPQANLEMRLAAHAIATIDDLAAGRELAAPPGWLREQIEQDGALTAPALRALGDLVAAMASGARERPRLLVAEPWTSGVVGALTPLARAGRIDVTLAAASRKAIDRARGEARYDPAIGFLDLGDEAACASPFRFDALVMQAAGLGEGDAAPAVLTRCLARDALAICVAPGVDAATQFLLSLFASDGRGDAILTPAVREHATATLARLGAADIRVHGTADSLGALLVARLPGTQESGEAALAPAIHVSREPVAFGAASLDHASVARDDLAALLSAEGQAVDIVFDASGEGEADGAEAVATVMLSFKAALEAAAAHTPAPRLFVTTTGALSLTRPSPIGAALRAAARVAINEFPALDIRLADFAPGLGDARRTKALADLRRFSGGETELMVDAEGVAALRVRRNILPPAPLAEGDRAVLRFGQPGRLDSSQWIAAPRQAPGPGEIEIAVAAVGLNYRDILVGLGVLDDDLLGAGLTAASLGFECAGVVTRVGAGVAALVPGDRVMGFARDAFASHLVAPAWHFFKAPARLDLAAAATIPVAFGTAHFALLKRGQLAAGESVLIHGGAGGVGLAAIQFARAAKARVLASASTPERRVIARAAGADETYESRHEGFVEPIRAAHGGVDVVLNSLAGSAMEASLRLTKPFGRFLELGKRDYLENTHVGLRPFVRNLAYFGVDLDELLKHDRALVEAMMADISARFEAGELTPPPYRVFEGHEVAAAFRLMQASHHAGKIVVRPAQFAAPDASALRATIAPGVYLVAGGTRGFGLSSARWLAEKGATTLVLASRSGAVEPGREDELAAIRRVGAKVVVEAVDIADAAAVKAMARRIVAAYGPLRGVIHAAAALEDGFIGGLTAERLAAGLTAKIEGARALAAAVDDQPLDLFVLYSSATAMIGSPGQAAYVAANAWLESFAAQRRAAGKPGLAVGWGAIGDAGMLARDRKLAQRLRRTTGVAPLAAGEALAHLGRLLALGPAAAPIQVYAQIAPSAAAEKMKLMRGPSLADLGLARAEEGREGAGDLVALIEGKSDDEARPLVLAALRRELAHILRVPEEAVDVTRPLGEIGLDSLMALELQMSVEQLTGAEIPLMGAGDRKLGELAGMVIAALRGADEAGATSGGEAASGTMLAVMAERHGSGQVTAQEKQAVQRALAEAKRGE